MLKSLRNSILAVVLSLFATCAQAAGPNFLWNSGTSNNGQIASALTLMTTELNGLTNTSVIISSVVNGSGLVTNSDTGAAIWGTIVFTSGGSGPTCAAGGNVALWFLTSLDGSVFESTTAVPPRAPDAVVPLPVAAITSLVYQAPGLVRIPALKFKVLAQNNCGSTLSATLNTIKVGLQAVTY